MVMSQRERDQLQGVVDMLEREVKRKDPQTHALSLEALDTLTDLLRHSVVTRIGRADGHPT